MALLEVTLLLTVIGFLVYKWATSQYDILNQRKVPHEKPMPLIGNIPFAVFRKKASYPVTLLRFHQKFKDSKVYGIYQLRKPNIFIRDLDLIKQVAIKDFDKFANRKLTGETTKENIFAKSLVSLNDQPWREMRNTLTPTFTGSKMRIMFELINESCLESVQHIEEELKANSAQSLDIELKDYFTRFANDVIANAVFGLKINSYKTKNNDFYTIGRELTLVTTTMMLKGLLMNLLPTLAKWLKVSIDDQQRVGYFKKLVFEAIKYREAHNIIRPDMIHLLMEAKKQFVANKTAETNKHASFTDEDILAQCLLFFFAGFETVSTCLSFTTYELAVNPDKQQLLYEEIKAIEQDLNGGPLKYEDLNKMKYMDMVVSESLRMWPPAAATNRFCSGDYQLKDSDDNVVVELKRGDLVYFPIFALHHDPEHFEEPFKFKPERFSDENREHIRSMSYLPFGAGPRNCIGNRLALMETKALIYHLFSKFKFVRHEKTPDNMLDSLKGFLLQPREFWLKVEPRK